MTSRKATIYARLGQTWSLTHQLVRYAGSILGDNDIKYEVVDVCDQDSSALVGKLSRQIGAPIIVLDGEIYYLGRILYLDLQSSRK